MRKLIALCLPLLVFTVTVTLATGRLSVGNAFVAFSRAASRVEVQSSRDEIPSPREWVPFEADVRVSSPGKEEVTGRFHRSADGSVRLETGLSGRIQGCVNPAHFERELLPNAARRYLDQRPYEAPVRWMAPSETIAGSKRVAVSLSSVLHARSGAVVLR